MHVHREVDGVLIGHVAVHIRLLCWKCHRRLNQRSSDPRVQPWIV